MKLLIMIYEVDTNIVSLPKKKEYHDKFEKIVLLRLSLNFENNS